MRRTWLWILQAKKLSSLKSITYVSWYPPLSQLVIFRRRPGVLPVSGNTIVGCKSSYSCTLKQGHSLMKKRILGNLCCCRSMSSSISQIEIWDNRYEKRKRKGDPHTFAYHFMGYSSLYPFYYFPEKVRMRLRSVVISCCRFSVEIPFCHF